MTDGDALLAAIRANPDEDVPRLMYADCIEGDDPERAEFIRDSCHVSRLGLPDGPCEDGCPCGGAGNRVAETISRRGNEWLPMFPGENPRELHFTWNRGFPHRVTSSAESWLRFADAITASHPVTAVTLTTRLAWAARNYDAVLFERGNPASERLCRVMDPDVIDKALREGIEVVLRHEWPGIAFTHAAEPVIARWNFPEQLTNENIQRRVAMHGSVDVDFGDVVYTYRR